MKSMEEAKEDLMEYEGILRDSHEEVWEEYKGTYGEVKHLHRRRTRASIIHDHIIEKVKNKLGGFRGIEWIESNRIWFLNIKGKYTIRFKMLDGAKKAKCIQTNHTKNYFQQLDIPDLPETTRLVVGYILNKMETAISDICVVCPSGGTNSWYYSLMEARQLEIFEDITTEDAYKKPDQVKVKEFQEKRKKDGTKN